MEKMSENISVLESKISELKVELAYATGKVKGTPPSGKIKDADRVKSQLEKAELRLKKLNVQRQLKSDNKTVALGTSKINYMDPRITVSWCKMKQVPIEKIFNKSILEKFPWAMEVPKSWRF